MDDTLDLTRGTGYYGHIAYYAILIAKEISDGFCYADESKTNLLYYYGDPLSLTIPNTVKEIGEMTFMDCKNLCSLTLGTGVESVKNGAFSSCSSLCKLTLLPNSVPSGLVDALPDAPSEGRITYVASNRYTGYKYGTIKNYEYLSYAFEVDGIKYVPISQSERTCAAIDCTYDSEVKNIVIGETVEYRGVEMKVVKINPYLLMKNSSIESVDVSANTDIPTCFAKNCTKIKQLKLNNTGAIGQFAFQGAMQGEDENRNNNCSIGVSAFQNCTGLTTASLAESVTSIGASAFSGCPNLESINIPSQITSIESSTFAGCSSLAEISLPNGLISIKANAFENSGLTEITIPGNVTEIGNGAFNGCKALGKFVATDGSSDLKMGYNSSNKGLFYDCPLNEVVLGRNLSYDTKSSAGYSPFYRNTVLEKATLTDIPTEVFTNEFYGCTALKEVTIGDGVKKIGDYAFSGCSALESFSFGLRVKRIGAEAFSDCTAMTKLYAEPITPPTCGTQTLSDINKWECTLYVPEEGLGNYTTASQWKDFFFTEAYDFSSGIEAVKAEQGFDGIYRVYDLSGTPVLQTRNANDLTRLTRGIYIVNGKKICVK